MAQSSHMIIVIAFVFAALQFIFVGLRIWARRIRRNPLAIDDYLVISASALFIICVVIPILVGCFGGHMGDHGRVENGHIVPPTYLYTVHGWVLKTFNTWPLTFAKLGILFFYRRIFQGSKFFATTWVVICLTTIWGIAFFFACLFECTPVLLSFRVPSNDPRLTCVDSVQLFYAVSISDFLIDCIILSIPLPFVWKLQMPLRHKIAVSGIFLTCILTIAASITRMVVFVYADKKLAAGDMDVSWYAAPTEYWVLIEASLSIISASLPTLRPIFTGMSLQSVIRSLRGVTSLRSSSGNRSRRKASSSSTEVIGTGHTYLPDSVHGSTNAYIMHEVPPVPHNTEKITVQKTWTNDFDLSKGPPEGV